ncbi:M56 family metallopeptidase [Parashewanella spongiae]|nr:M56 family metallopeptidase [Parashewanella spongiae]MCL1080086.1 M56 family metallopeptidase [Parashewanella spongiae]
MIAQFVFLNVIFVLIACLIFILRKPVNRLFGIHAVYSLWYSIPYFVIAFALTPWIFGSVVSLDIELVKVISTYSASELSQHQTFINNNLAIYLWVTGFALMQTFFIFQLGQLNQLKSTAEKELSFKMLSVFSHKDISSPVLAGFLSPSILVPANFKQLSSEDQESILAHEQAHHQRNDLLANLFAWVFLSLLWCNPLAWMAYKRFRQDQELACDADVTVKYNTKQKQNYSQMLVNFSQHHATHLFTTPYGNKTTIKERIMQLKNHQQKGKSTILTLAVIMIMSTIGVLTNLPVIAGNDHQGPKPIVRVNPQYPQEAAKLGQTGFVVIEFKVSEKDGSVHSAHVSESSPAGVFDQAGLDAVKKWKYKPNPDTTETVKVRLDFSIAPEDETLERIKIESGDQH